MDALHTWDPANQQEWAEVLGLVPVPLFGNDRENEWPGKCHVLLDGSSSSFAIYSTDDAELRHDPKPVSWAWSANLRHALIMTPQSNEMLLRRWDRPEYRRFHLPEHSGGAQELLSLLEDAPPAQKPDVVLYLLRAFRRLRAAVPDPDPLHVVRVFNAMLSGVEAVRRGVILKRDWQTAQTIEDALKAIDRSLLEEAEAEELPDTVRHARLGGLLDAFLDPDPATGSILDPDLLLRHAAGQFYQEAHLVIEREPQLALPGLAGDEEPHGRLLRGAYYTPTVLARSLVQQAFSVCKPPFIGGGSVEILDPACGSGLFLQEALRELELRRFRGEVTLTGLDISPIACTIARFCLNRAAGESRSHGINVQVKVKEADALVEPWGEPDVILMNPPFVPWPAMSGTERSAIRDVLGQLLHGRADMAMAFVWKAAGCLQPGSAMASLIPAPLLESASGVHWRDALRQSMRVHFLGRFQGYGLFRHALVEPAFLVLTKRTAAEESLRPFSTLLACPGAEDAAVRGLRQCTASRSSCSLSGPGWEILQLPADRLSGGSWLPRSGTHAELVGQLSAARMTTVGDLFDVRQGVRTGCNRVFVLQGRDLDMLPQREQACFRPAATTSTIVDGALQRRLYVFYPYDAHGLKLKTEEELKAGVPAYYRRWLLPARADLVRRHRATEANWWTLAEERNWQYEPRRKLVTKYFGEEGSFAFDDRGEFVVVQGFAWLWKGGSQDEDDESVEFYDSSRLPYAYLAILNSALFRGLLSWYCPSVAGGQFDLSPRYVNEVFLPDLTSALGVPTDLIEDLMGLGRQIHCGTMPRPDLVREAAARAYGVQP